jgi:hypothetical protein
VGAQRLQHRETPKESDYELAAKKYKPERTCILFVAESPPSCIDRYFYFEDVTRADFLWIALMKALYPSEWERTRKERPRKRYWLKRFQENGFRLIDAVKAPICGSHNRVSIIREGASKLLDEIKKIAPKQVVLIKATVHEALFQKLRDAGLPVVNEKPLPFPASGWQNDFANEFRSLVDARKLQLCSMRAQT